ncbi:cytochrome b-c1 complex subunit Rieske, mitochondrial-like isoform X1 [Penaeus chinensis]|uniref:cytochrome b-c1 complex subunit Rieske, mitochondrial-like isoform X1 n=1 Tax=Penaeus chinensis TaxID=139456 RepID=UPI001FB61BFA|nr:cytochrome b-c1 complex subunit Rieske, mitochondrial-like isoform X1 [Penaeus chinensis]
MLSYIGRSSQFAPALKGTAQAVAGGLRNVVPGAVDAAAPELVQKAPLALTPASMAKRCPTGAVVAKAGLGASSQVRYAHTDIQVPDFSAYRRDDVKDTRAKAGESAPTRSAFTYMLVGGGTVTGIYSAKAVVSQFVSSMSASADVLALAKIEIKLDDIPEGKSVTFKWRGKPLFVRHRTDEEVSTEGAVDMGSLRDPEHDSVRCKEPKWLIVLGVCTHLGCVPIADAGDYGGYYCPCHGSHYDTAGRIRKGPAPLNLEIPEYSFPEDGLLIVG